MKYVVCRTTQRSFEADRPPCERASAETLIVADIQPKNILNFSHLKLNWYANGSNHREIEGMLVREMPVDVWTVEIKDLRKFLEEHRRVVISIFSDKLLQLEIYDDYRE